MEQNKIKKFNQLLQNIVYCASEPNSHLQQYLDDSKVSHKIQNITDIKAQCSVKEAQHLLDCCPSLKKLGQVNLEQSYGEKEFKKLLQHPSLQHIELRVNEIEQIPEATNKVKGLTLVDINCLIKKDIAYRCPSLTKIAYQNFNSPELEIQIRLFQNIGKLKQLKELQLNFIQLENRTINTLSQNIPQLQKLSLMNCTFNKDSTAIVLPNLKLIQLQVYEQSVFGLLTTISERQIPLILGVNFWTFSPEQKKLFIEILSSFSFVIKNLELYHHHSIQIIDWINLKPHSLEHLKIYRNNRIDMSIIKKLVPLQRQLRYLNLDRCSIGDRALILISELKKLSNLQLYCCQFTNKGMVYLKKLKGLQILLVFSQNITNQCHISILCNLKRMWKGKITSVSQWEETKAGRENIWQLRYFV